MQIKDSFSVSLVSGEYSKFFKASETTGLFSIVFNASIFTIYYPPLIYYGKIITKDKKERKWTYRVKWWINDSFNGRFRKYSVNKAYFFSF